MKDEQMRGLVQKVAKPDPERTESDLQSDVKSLLLALNLNVSRKDLHLEAPLRDGTRRRIDIEIGQTVIETKKDLQRAGVLDEAVKQLAGYVKKRTEQLGARYLGVLTDGASWHLYELVENDLRLVTTHVVNSDDPDVEKLQVWLEVVLATQTAIKPTPEEITRRLGVESPTYLLNHSSLRRIYDSVADHPEVSIKRRLWAKLLRTAVGAGFKDDRELFIDHSLLVLQANLIAHAVLGFDLRQFVGAERALVQGVEFKNAQIGNVVEPDFFDWLLQSPEGESFVANLAREIRRFQWAEVEHDVLKVLYESVITPSVRKSLGEYYTPDWLAEHVVETNVLNPLTDRVLDPACGSGTFLFHSVRRFLHAADVAGISNGQAISSLEDLIFGIDVHPVSVQLARVTYLLAIGLDRLTSEDRPPFSVPVYLGDSVQWESSGSSADGTCLTVNVDAADLTEETTDTLFSVGERLSFPLLVVNDPGTFDRLVSDVAAKAQTYVKAGTKKPSIRSLMSQYGIVDDGDRQILQETFDVMCDLNARGENHIWGYYVRNLVRPLWFALEHRQVDVLVGNPPWVAYRFMTDAMQRNYQRLSKQRRITAYGQNASNQDLVALFIARTVEQYLKQGGRFGYVTPRSVLSRAQYEGFRKAAWAPTAGGRVTVQFDKAWDLDEVEPDIFPVPAAVVSGVRGDSATPLSSVVLKYRGKIQKRSTSWADASSLLSITEGDVKAISAGAGFRSPYGKSVFMGATIRPQMLFFVTELRSGPLGAGFRRVKVESLRPPLEKEPWKLLPGISGNVEKQFVQPVLLGSTVLPHRLLEPRKAVVPVLDGRVLGREEIDDYPGLASWWNDASKLWLANRGDKNGLSLIERMNYQRGVTSQLVKGSHRVVYSKSGTRLAAARVEGQQPLIEQSLYWLTVPSREAAQYLVGVINSPTVLERVADYQSRGLFGGRDFVKLVWQLPIPYFSPANPLHMEIVELSARAEAVANTVAIPDGLGFQAARKLVRAALEDQGITAALNARVIALLESD
ncbi:N-6 DNA methylase [Streptomyces sp. NPDC054829]